MHLITKSELGQRHGKKQIVIIHPIAGIQLVSFPLIRPPYEAMNRFGSLYS